MAFPWYSLIHLVHLIEFNREPLVGTLGGGPIVALTTSEVICGGIGVKILDKPNDFCLYVIAHLLVIISAFATKT